MISQLQLTNFKCFDAVTLPISPLTLLAGENGAGKSSIIQALLLLRQSHQQGLLEGGSLALNGALTRIGSGRDALFEGATEDKFGFSIQWTDDSTTGWTFEYGRESDVIRLQSRPSVGFSRRSLFTDEFHYLQAERLGPRVASETSDLEVRHHRQLGTQGEYVVHFLAVYGGDPVQAEALVQKGATPDLRSQAEVWLSEICPGTRIHFDEKAASLLDLVSLRYSFAAGELRSRQFRATNVGFGITYVLPIIVAALSAQRGALLIVENPEAHLHPHAQSVIGRFLGLAAESGLQVLIETHSDHVLNGLRVAVREKKVKQSNVGIHFITRDAAKKVVSPKIDQDGRLDAWPAGFFDEWDRNLDALLE